jgi:DNA-directed RNA polymerase subunit K/omega
MGAPVLLDLPKKIIDPITIATEEYQNEVVPITVRRGAKTD